MEDINRLGIEIILKAREWFYSRRKLRKLLDSKSASRSQVDAQKRVYNKICDELEKLSYQLEVQFKQQGVQVPQKRLDFPWRKLFTVIAMGAKAVEEAVGSNKIPGVIDVPGEDVK